MHARKLESLFDTRFIRSATVFVKLLKLIIPAHDFGHCMELNLAIDGSQHVATGSYKMSLMNFTAKIATSNGARSRAFPSTYGAICILYIVRVSIAAVGPA